MVLSINMEGVWWVPLIFFHEGSIWTIQRAFIPFILHKTIFIHFVHHGTKFYDRCIKAYDTKIQRR